jgi:hypothetical protein
MMTILGKVLISAPPLHEGEFGVRLVDLPHVQLLVLLQAGVNLVGFVALGGAGGHDVGHSQAPAVPTHLLDGREDLVRHVLGPGNVERGGE